MGGRNFVRSVSARNTNSNKDIIQLINDLENTFINKQKNDKRMPIFISETQPITDKNEYLWLKVLSSTLVDDTLRIVLKTKESTNDSVFIVTTDEYSREITNFAELSSDDYSVTIEVIK